MTVPRRLERLFYCLISAVLMFALPARCAEPNRTLVSDTIYRADGTPAQGTILISWPAFSTADGKPVAAGTLSVKIAANGSVNIPLVPTQGATPSGTAYKVVLSLEDGATSTEYWAVPTLSPTTVAAIRSTQVPATVAMQVVSRDYVDAQLATAVRRNGDETIAGAKTFSSSPLVPPPAMEAAAANKSYVDTAVSAGTQVKTCIALRDAGAKGDGTTDDSAAFAAASASHRAICGASGDTYRLATKTVVNASNLALRGNQAQIKCDVTDDCLVINSAASSNAHGDVLIEGWRFISGNIGGGLGKAVLTTNAMKTTIRGNQFAGVGTGRWQYNIRVMDDQSVAIEDNDFNPNGDGAGYGPMSTCTAGSWCGWAIYGDGPPSYQTGHISGNNISMGCRGNGISLNSGNGMTIENNVIQGFNQFGVFYHNATYQGLSDSGNYMEVGSCANSLDAHLGQAGYFVRGGWLQHGDMRGGGGTGSAMSGVDGLPTFANKTKSPADLACYPVGAANKAHCTRVYYIVFHKPIGGTEKYSVPLPLGLAFSDNSTAVDLYWYGSDDASTRYDILVATGASALDAPSTNASAPWGTGAWAVATNQTTAGICASQVCHYRDALACNNDAEDGKAACASYTVNLAQWYSPKLDFWPGNAVMTSKEDTTTAPAVARLFGSAQGVLPLVSTVTAASSYPFAATLTDSSHDQAWSGHFGSASLIHRPPVGTTNGLATGGLLMPVSQNGNTLAGAKGKLNFGQYSGGVSKGCYVTYRDANPEKTVADVGNQPALDKEDACVGAEDLAGSLAWMGQQFSFYAQPASAAVALDGTTWKLRVTTSLVEAKVPVKATGLEIGGVANGCATWSGTSLTSTGAPCGGGSSSTGGFLAGFNAGSSICCGNGYFPAAGGGQQSTAAMACTPLPAGTTTGFFAHFGTNVPSGSTVVVTLLKNGAATPVSCTVEAGALACSDTAHSATFADGDCAAITTNMTGSTYNTPLATLVKF